MGYCMSQKNGSFSFKEDADQNEILDAIQSLCLSREYRPVSDEWENHFSWVNSNLVINAKTVEEALSAFRWGLNDGWGIEFQGEKFGNDFNLFTAIAPFVKEGSFIEMVGEDNDRWRWVFDGKTCTEKAARVVWE